MPRPVPEIALEAVEREQLENWVRSRKTEKRLHERAQMILWTAEGVAGQEIAQRMRCHAPKVSKWIKRFQEARLAGLVDKPRSGEKRRKYSSADEQRVLKSLDEPVPAPYSTWTGGLLAGHLGYSDDFVWSVMRRHKISLARRKSWCISTDPEFAQKAADVVGLYLAPPECAVVLSVDEKPSIQALERAQGWLRLPNGRAITGFSHEYKRHGTTTLFAALEVATGQVKAGHYKRRRRVEFLDFMNEVVADHPGKEIHVILDNLNTHKPKRDLWLARHPHVHFHFTPTRASWLNQIECWFSVLSRKALRGSSFTSIKEVIEQINAFVEHWNENAHPFQWTKSIVHPSAPKHNYSNILN